MRRLALGLVAVAVAASAACSSPGTVPAALRPSAVPSPAVVRDLAQTHGFADDVTEAFDAEVRPGLRLLAKTVTPDGLVAGSLLDGESRAHAIVLVDPKTGKVEETAREQRPAKDAVDTPQFRPIAADGAHVAWIEATPGLNYTDAKVMLYDRAKRTTSVVAETGRKEPACAPNDGLFLTAGRLWWTACDGSADQAVFSAAVADPAPVVRAAHAGLLGVAEDGDVVVRQSLKGDDPGQVLRLAPDGTRKEVISEGGRLLMAASADVTVFSDANRTELRLRHDGREEWVPHRTSAAPVAAGRFAAWTAEDPVGTAWLFDTGTDTVYRLPTPSFAVLTPDHLLLADSFSAPGEYSLLPLSTLFA
ncbi:hypothetical protein EDD29_1256 [Actinocorallia herbida]|uniref:Uncharacterized protein n=1 Tax=Actinocorallia herbida TaxID=58109 RepID=A0A3N1CQZ3_9ACTN|nr:hypothetical protein [Actinocorallia herbida]ROO83747.1 hypothetical protein EDD29_1256 [Actinocorallia herbida]